MVSNGWDRYAMAWFGSVGKGRVRSGQVRRGMDKILRFWWGTA